MEEVQTMFRDSQTHGFRSAVWRDKAGIMHAAVGSQIISWDRGTFIMWTACGKKDIPASSAWLQNPEDRVTCNNCKKIAP